MAHVIYGGTNEYDSLIYGPKAEGTLRYIEQNMQNVSQMLSSTLTDAGRSFFSTAADLWNQFHGSEAVRLANAAMRKASSIFQVDVIRNISSIEEIQNAPQCMIRYIMAEPTVRQLYHDQRCEGYGDSYIDLYKNDMGERHYDYRRVMDGMVVDTDDGGWKHSHYIEELVTGDRDLTHGEKTDVLSAWDYVKHYVKVGEYDPTSSWNNKL